MYVNVHAIILRSERVGEKDKRLSIYTREQGRLMALARGVNRPGARLAAATEPAVESRFRLWHGEHQPFARITGGAVESSFPNLRSQWVRMSTAQFLCEWMDRLTALGQPQPEKYELLRRALSALEKGDRLLIRLAFLVQFLEKAGYSVGEEILGSSGYERLRETVALLKAFDFSPDASFPELAESAPMLEDRFLKFVAPLLDRPLKTLVHERSLTSYRTQKRS
ncbi:MAG: DNA repair protein RecO [Elusimicrobia bacterium]|nr:DNA repair protein RecO [Elusimicrobiota bacterium]